MKKSLMTLVVLIVLTLISAMLSQSTETYVVIGIIVLAAFKFIGVSFYFMELKHANSIWKGSILIFLMLFMTTVLMIFHN